MQDRRIEGGTSESIQYNGAMMKTAYTPEFYYQYSKDFDYRSYLETKSHFDRVELSVDSGIRKLIASSEALSDANIHEVRQVGAKIDEGFDRLTVSIEAVSRSIVDLRSVCEYGFGELSLKLSGINDSLDQLVKIAKTPDQTWALEQFSISQDAFRRNLFSEALDYVNRAINGHGTRSGYRLEHRFYMLRGLIRLGNYKNYDPEIVDLHAAVDDFLTASKYAAHDSKIDCARSFGLAGWASYCLGNFEASESYFNKSLAMYPDDAQSAFDLSKLFFQLNRKLEAATHFRTAIKTDFKFGIRAGSDPDFLQNIETVEEIIKSYQGELRSSLDATFKKYSALGIPSKIDILTGQGANITNEVRFLTSAETNALTAPISDLLEWTKTAPEELQKIQNTVHSVKSALLARASDLRRQSGGRLLPYDTDGSFAAFGLGGTAIWGIIQYNSAPDLFDFLVEFILGSIFIMPLSGFVGTWIVLPILGVVRNTGGSLNRNSEAGQLETLASRL